MGGPGVCNDLGMDLLDTSRRASNTLTTAGVPIEAVLSNSWLAAVPRMAKSLALAPATVDVDTSCTAGRQRLLFWPVNVIEGWRSALQPHAPWKAARH